MIKERLFLESDLKHDFFFCQLSTRFMKAQSDFFKRNGNKLNILRKGNLIVICTKTNMYLYKEVKQFARVI